MKQMAHLSGLALGHFIEAAILLEAYHTSTMCAAVNVDAGTLIGNFPNSNISDTIDLGKHPIPLCQAKKRLQKLPPLGTF
jgi:hypothetical protein